MLSSGTRGRPHIIKVLSQCPPIQRIEDAVPAQAMCWEAMGSQSTLFHFKLHRLNGQLCCILLQIGLSDIVDWSYIWAHLYWKSFLAAVDGSAWSARILNFWYINVGMHHLSLSLSVSPPCNTNVFTDIHWYTQYISIDISYSTYTYTRIYIYIFF